ncbi:MAG TPA: glycosyltransferase [Candidatus Limnocylindrales bacterium]|nr:glycosyltransferase [Candidatus Limnocylindrales bacterium]
MSDAPVAIRPALGAAPAPIAYVMSRFPKLTETFILYELLAVEAQGQPVELYPLLRYREPVSHPEAIALMDRAHYQPFLSRAILASQVRALRHRPRAYLGALAALMRGTLGSANYFFGGLAIFPKVVHMALRMEADGVRHVHCHFSNHPAAAGFVIHRLTGIPYSFVAHGSDLHVDRHMLDRKVAEAAFVVAISRDNLEEIVGDVGPTARDRVEVIHCGVDTAALRPRPGPRPADRPFTILCIGTLHEVKGQAVLVDACRILRDRGIGIVARIIGDGQDESMLRERIAAAGLADVVHLDGRRTRAEVIEALGDADLLVAPSVVASDGKREGIPVVLMEAMSCGLPVVASRLSGIPELVDDGVSGMLVTPGDAVALADAIARLAAEPGLRARMGAAARARIERDFDLMTNARAILERIADAAARRAPAHAAVADPRRPDPRLDPRPSPGDQP